MFLSLFTNLLALAVFYALAICSQAFCWELLLFQCVLQALTNEFWAELFYVPFKGRRVFAAPGEEEVSASRRRRVARTLSPFALVFPALVFAALFAVGVWSGAEFSGALMLPPSRELLLCSLSAQGALMLMTLSLGPPPLSFRSVAEWLRARSEKASAEERAALPTVATPDMLPHGLPAGVTLPPLPETASALLSAVRLPCRAAAPPAAGGGAGAAFHRSCRGGPPALHQQ